MPDQSVLTRGRERFRWERCERFASKEARALGTSSEMLLNRLLSHLSQLHPEPPLHHQHHHDHHHQQQRRTEQNLTQRGITLPASAIGWLAVQVISNRPTKESDEQAEDHQHNYQDNGMHRGDTKHLEAPENHNYEDECDDMLVNKYSQEDISLLRSLLPRLTHIRITRELWPPNNGYTSSTPEYDSNIPADERETRLASLPQNTNASNLAIGSTTHSRSCHRFIRFLQKLRNNPSVDFRLFPNATVVVLDSVQPEWIRHIDSIRNSLQVLRVERGCLYHVPSFFLESEKKRGNRYPATPEGFANVDDGDNAYKCLSYLKMSSCGIGEMSGLRDKPELFKSMPNLVSICLSHNDLQTEWQALAGMSRLPYLETLDLSFNYLSCLRHASLRLGQIQVLILTSNRISSAEGIERLYGLRELKLDHNRIPSVSCLSGLAKLPELTSLFIDGNPLSFHGASETMETGASSDHRVGILNMFWRQRSSGLGVDSIEGVQALNQKMVFILPALDGRVATNIELNHIRNLTYQVTPFTPILIPHARNEATVMHFGRWMPTTRRRRRVERQRPDNRAVITDKLRSRKVQKMTSSVSNSSREIKFVTEDVFKLISIKDFTQSDESSNESTEEVCNENQLSWPKPSPPRASRNEKEDFGVKEADSKAKPNCVASPESESPTEKRDEVNIPGTPTRSIFCETATDSISREISEETEPPRKLKFATAELVMRSASQAVNIHDQDWDTILGLATHGLIPDGKLLNTAAERQGVLLDQTALLNLSADASSIVLADINREAARNLSERNLPCEQIWSDDSSIPSSLGTSRDGPNAQNKFRVAEENSVYDGPDAYSGMLVLTNMDMYFRSFVFPTPKSGANHIEPPDIIFPRIQLCSDDWRLGEVDLTSSGEGRIDDIGTRLERFVRVWDEELIPCGETALKRLAPNRSARLGFHGDVSYHDNGKPDTYSICRDVTLCLSSHAFYVIPRNDRITSRSRKKFPAPISKNSYFRDAPWPHAVARHSLKHLQGINIGFGFQRLTLRFSAPGPKMADPFTYVLLTSDKMTTVSLLQDFQDAAKDIANSAVVNLLENEKLQIDNDDRTFLEAVSSAVAPDIVGAVLHYQIVLQRWKRGERGEVRRACVLTDIKIYLLDEDYSGDALEVTQSNSLEDGFCKHRMVDQANLAQISEVQAAGADPKAITIVITPTGRLSRVHRWRLVCRTSEGAERLVNDVRKALDMD